MGLVLGRNRFRRLDSGNFWRGPVDDHGHLHGQGTVRLAASDDSTISGNFVHGLLQGPGRHMAADGYCRIYEGQYVNGRREGQGQDGEGYTGDWHNGLRHGIGKLETTKFTYKGGFVAGEMTDENANISYSRRNVSHSEPDWYEGPVLNGKCHGKGYLKYGGTISYYDGDFVDDLKHGKGRMVLDTITDVYRYVGDYRYDKPHGSGVEHKGNYVYKGDFVEGKRHGNGKMLLRFPDLYNYYTLRLKRTHDHAQLVHFAISIEGEWWEGEPQNKVIVEYGFGKHNVANGVVALKTGKTVTFDEFIQSQVEGAIASND